MVRRAQRKPEPVKRWLAFLRNHREAIAAMDFIRPDRHVRHSVVLHHRALQRHPAFPTEAWVVQQLREAFPYDSAQKYLIFDGDTKFGYGTIAAVESMGGTPIRTSFCNPWQNGVEERWVGSCRDLLDHQIAFGEHHLKRLLPEYVRYYHDDRTHLGLAKATPVQRKVVGDHDPRQILSRPRLDCITGMISRPEPVSAFCFSTSGRSMSAVQDSSHNRSIQLVTRDVQTPRHPALIAREAANNCSLSSLAKRTLLRHH